MYFVPYTLCEYGRPKDEDESKECIGEWRGEKIRD